MNKTIPLFKVFMSDNAAEEAKNTLMSGWIGQGKKVESFEYALNDYLSWQSLVTLNSGTSALQLALRLAGVGPGNCVLSVPLSCLATNVPILASYANIRWADINPLTCNIDIDDTVNKVNEDISAIMLVHWGGVPVDIDMLSERIIEKLGYCPPIVEDCAHSFGAKYKYGKSFIGTSGNLCCFSFQAIKFLTTIDGGMLTCDPKYYKEAKLMRWYGIDRENNGVKKDFRSDTPVEHWGYKFHMNDVCASVGIENLKFIDWILDQHRRNAKYYDIELANIDGVTLFDVPEGANPSYWLYTIKVEDRDNFMRHMKSRGIVVSKVHERNDNHPCLSEYKADLPKLDSFVNNYVCLPVGWWVKPEDANHIVEAIKEGW